MKKPPTSMFRVVKTGRNTAGPTSPRMPAAMVKPTSMAMAKLTTAARTKNANADGDALSPTDGYKMAANDNAATTSAGISTMMRCAT